MPRTDVVGGRRYRADVHEFMPRAAATMADVVRRIPTDRFEAATPVGRQMGVFGPEVAVPDDAPVLDRLLGLAGRDPSWRPATEPTSSR